MLNWYLGRIAYTTAECDSAIQHAIAVVTPGAPMGKQLLNKQIDDEITLTIAGKAHEYVVVEIL